ncbi:MAG TPA: VWA domain-containing protein [Anaerolineales bacterium]|nr:VWA domain-containing protein [Anaerolineales bacterium]
MSFIWSSLLYSLLVVPVLLWLYFRAQRRRREFGARYGSLGIVKDTAKSSFSRRRHIPTLVFIVGITILLISMARPQATVSLPKLEGTVILTFDVSGSMAADDLKPTRMEAAKAAASEFVKKQPSNVSIGVVAFSDGGISIQTPTNDRAQTLETIYRLVPRRGTSLGNGILVSLNTIVVSAGDPAILNSNNFSTPNASTPAQAPQGWYPSSVIVLLSDGENNQPPDPVLAADLAADLGVRIYTIGIGSTAGATLEVEGFTVFSQLDEGLLQNISTTTGGVYYNAANEEDLVRIYSDLKPKLSIKSEEIEVTSLFAGAGFLLFLVAGALSLLWFGRVP